MTNIFQYSKEVQKLNEKYKIIYADPPWTYRDRALAGNRGAGCKYNLMTDEELLSLDIRAISANDSVLFMWATFPKIAEALKLMDYWGFTYKTVAFTWVKKYSNGNTFVGMGSWSRANAEIVLLGTRGKPKRASASVRQIVETVPEKHSKKPGIVRDRIVQLCGDLPRIELFARERCQGWDSWGDEL